MWFFANISLPSQRDGEMLINSKTLGGLLQKPAMPMPQRVRSGERSSSAGPLCFSFTSAPSLLAASGGEPSISRSNTLTLVPKTEGGQDRVGEKMLFKQPQCV